jgi:hypothetical protein
LLASLQGLSGVGRALRGADGGIVGDVSLSIPTNNANDPATTMTNTTTKYSQCMVSGRLSPEVSESIQRKLGVADGVLDVLVPKIRLKGAGVVSLVGQDDAAGMPEPVPVGLGLGAPRLTNLESSIAAFVFGSDPKYGALAHV